ncbi:MAG: YadA C-terminal domain-containing protein [Alphaproteobacteria bacterium]|nr:YadA C-terminal domain-containing protein [Alphaproteobacteria bacterium]
MRQSKTTLKELTAQYRSVLKRAFIAGVMAVATANSANATITPSDISAINDSINMVQSDGNYTTSMGDFNAGTTDYSTEAGYGLYTYDHDNNPETAEIALTTNNGTETLDNAVFTYTDNTGATTNLGDNATGFTTSDFTGAAGTIDVADGTTDLTTLEANTTTVDLGNYQYMANFDNSGDALTALTADAPELASFHNDVTLTTGAITVNGNDETNKPSIDQYGFTVDLHDGSTGNFDLVYNESTHLYSYNYDGDVVLDAADIAAADAQVSSQSANLIADTTLFNNAVATNTTNYNSAVGHYNTVHGVYESDTNTQSTLNTNYGNYETSFAEAQANQTAAAGNLSEAQGAYAADLAIYTPVATAYNNYENSLGKSIDAKDETVLANAQAYADGLASNYDAAGSADAEKTRAQGEEAAIRSEFAAADTTLQNNIDAEALARANADTTLQNNIDNEVARATAQEAAIRGEIAAADALTLSKANSYTDSRVNTLEKNVSGGVAAATALSSVEVSNVKKGEVSVGGGYGYYNSQSAMAFGAAMGLSDNWSINAGAGIASGDKTQVAFRAGTNYKFKLF